MMKYYLYIFFVFLTFSAIANNAVADVGRDTSEVIRINKEAYANRLTDPAQTVNGATKALKIAQELGYKRGIGESYRIIGIGNNYLNKSTVAINNYLEALNYFQEINDLRSEARVNNNIGNLYRDNDYDLALEFFQKGLVMARKLSDDHLIASLYLNIGDIYYRKKSFYQALSYCEKSSQLFTVLKDSVNLIGAIHNKGVYYYYLRQYDKAESFLLEASNGAKKTDLNETVASVDLTLAAVYIAQNKFTEAEKTIEDGLTYTRIIKDTKIESDFKYTSYQLELKRRNYERALGYLQDIYKQDSTVFKHNTSSEINLIQAQVKQQARQRENEFLLQRQQYDRVKFWAVAIVAGLLLVLVAVLISNVKRKTQTNVQLTNLNAEVSRQKDNLDRINHHLEEIIDERTKDLQIKNKKLSEYSSYLSHQIRGPIATLKGLLNLEKEGLVDQPECIRMMNKSVGEIDDKIIEMSDMLHDPVRTSLEQ